MKSNIIIPLACACLIGVLPASAKYVGEWPMNEGAGTNLYDISGNNWNMTINGDPNLWGYQQPGAYDFANSGYATTAETAAVGWTSGDTLTLTATFNVLGNLADPGQNLGGGGVFSADYFVSGGNNLGFNAGAFYAQILTSGSPTMQFDISGVAPGVWSEPLPASVTNPSINGGWNTAQWIIKNDVAQNSMTLQFNLNGVDLGSPINISGGYLGDFTTISGYEGTELNIGSCAAGAYQTFNGALKNVSLMATAPVPEPASIAFAGLAILSLLVVRKWN